jgi:hypothetical protein
MARGPSEAAVVRQFIRRARFRLSLLLFVRHAGWSLTAAACVVAAGALSGLFPPRAGWFGAAALLVAAVGTALRRPTSLAAASAVDATLGLDDRLVAALSSLDSRDPFSVLIVRTAAARITSLTLAHALPFRFDRHVSLAAASLAVLAGVALSTGGAATPARQATGDGGGWVETAAPPAGTAVVRRNEAAAVRSASTGTARSESGRRGIDPGLALAERDTPRVRSYTPGDPPDDDRARGMASSGDTSDDKRALDGNAGRLGLNGALAESARGTSGQRAAAGDGGAGRTGAAAGVGATGAGSAADARSGGVGAGALSAVAPPAAARPGGAALAPTFRQPRSLDTAAFEGARGAVPPRLRRVVRDYLLRTNADEQE